MSERSPHASTNGRAHLLALGCEAALPGEVRARVAAEGSVAWVQDIYGAASLTRNPQHGYRAMLLDLRALSRPQLEAVIAVAARASLVVWLLPVDAGRTRTDAALHAGAIPWPQVIQPTDVRQPVAEQVEKRPPSALKAALHPDAARLSQVLLAGALNAVPTSRLAVTPSVAPAAVPHPNGHEHPSVAPPAETQAVTPPAEAAAPEAVASAPPVRFPEPKHESSAMPATVPNAPAPSRDSLQDLAARFSQAAAATSENVATPDPAKVEVTSTPPAEYDEMSPVLSEDELRALLGPPE